MIRNVKLVYFSPTGTTKAVAEAIAEGLAVEMREVVDITTPGGRTKLLTCSGDDLLILAAPVYMGRIPALATDWLNTIQADGTPVICVVVYGNRVYDNALLELKDIATAQGCTPVGGGAYIGEHSFASQDKPVALGRPDKDDLVHARRFGEAVRAKLDSVDAAGDLAELTVPGVYPYEGITELWDVDFIEVSDECTQCEVCAKLCPVGAISADDSSDIDVKKCITCCACIKECSQGAREIKEGLVMDAANRLSTLFVDRKEPEFFI